MTREKQIEILMRDRCTQKEAERFLKDGTQIYTADELRETLDKWPEELIPENTGPEEAAETKAAYLEMLDHGVEMQDHSIVEVDGQKYIIAYVL